MLWKSLVPSTNSLHFQIPALTAEARASAKLAGAFLVGTMQNAPQWRIFLSVNLLKANGHCLNRTIPSNEIPFSLIMEYGHDGRLRNDIHGVPCQIGR